MLAVLGQTFTPYDLFVVLILVVLEGTLSIDNAVVLGLLARRLPVEQRARALSYGLVGAFAFRLIAIVLATTLLKWTVFKLIGGTYLLYIAVKHFVQQSDEADQSASIKKVAGRFWPTVAVIEMTDMAFAIDSILAAIGVVGRRPAQSDPTGLHPKLWVVFVGGFLGVILMRYAAMGFTKLLERFPNFEPAAYLLVLLIGAKLVVDWADSTWDWQSIDFHSAASPAFWVFWLTMVACFAFGFIGKKPAASGPVAK